MSGLTDAEREYRDKIRGDDKHAERMERDHESAEARADREQREIEASQREDYNWWRRQ